MNAQNPSDIDNTLAERGKRYGRFKIHADITQALKLLMRGESTPIPVYKTNWNDLNNSQKEALEMIAHKIGRILNGDPTYADSWTDIAGYARLIEIELINGNTPNNP